MRAARMVHAAADGVLKVGLIGCGMGYTWIKEAEQFLSSKLPLLKLGTLPLPQKKLLKFVQGLNKVVVFEETEPFVEGLCRKIFQEEKVKAEVLGRSGFLTSDGELSLAAVLDGIDQRRRDLDAAIYALQAAPGSDLIQIQRLKKRKLLLKDQITRLESQLIPDLNA